MRQILPKELKIKFVETLSELDGFSYEDSNPFLVKIGGKSYFVFLKNLSSAGYKKYPDNTRVQLPASSHFAKIAATDVPFIILGYDIDSDVMICWNPQKVKDRLNTKKNVSLYSRESFQANVPENEFKEAFLSNGEKFILFKRPMLISLFDNLEQLFLGFTNNLFSDPVIEINCDVKITEILDEELLSNIKPLLENHKVLEAVKIVSNFYQGLCLYSEMSFRDWYRLVEKYYSK